MPIKNSTLTYRWMQEVWNEGREEAIDEMMDENVVVHTTDEIKGKGTAAFKQFFQDFRSKFSEVHVEVQEVIAEADFETSRCMVEVTTADGQKVNFSGMTIVRIVNGKIVEAWNNFDFLSMYQQLGFKMVAPDAKPA